MADSVNNHTPILRANGKILTSDWTTLAYSAGSERFCVGARSVRKERRISGRALLGSVGENQRESRLGRSPQSPQSRPDEYGQEARRAKAADRQSLAEHVRPEPKTHFTRAGGN